jgi:hypothetical protein
LSPHTCLRIRAEQIIDDVSIDKFLSPGAAEELRACARIANRGMTHPNDEARWFGFLLLAHREQAPLDQDTLKDYLARNHVLEGITYRLTHEYYVAREVLRRYDGYLARRAATHSPDDEDETG